MATDNNLKGAKISPEFKARLEGMKQEQKVRAIVMLRDHNAGASSAQQQPRSNRQAIIKKIRRRAEAALPEIDEILERHGGKRLATQINALGSIPVETTAEGILALAASGQVKVIFEDQAITALPRLKRA